MTSYAHGTDFVAWFSEANARSLLSLARNSRSGPVPLPMGAAGRPDDGPSLEGDASRASVSEVVYFPEGGTGSLSDLAEKDPLLRLSRRSSLALVGFAGTVSHLNAEGQAYGEERGLQSRVSLNFPHSSETSRPGRIFHGELGFLSAVGIVPVAWLEALLSSPASLQSNGCCCPGGSHTFKGSEGFMLQGLCRLGLSGAPSPLTAAAFLTTVSTRTSTL